jgi:hypothetical protein
LASFAWEGLFCALLEHLVVADGLGGVWASDTFCILGRGGGKLAVGNFLGDFEVRRGKLVGRKVFAHK